MSEDEKLPGNLTLEEIREFRAALLKKLMFEPVADPGFRRPAVKLRTFIKETEEFIQRLRAIVERFQRLDGTIDELLKIVKGQHDYFVRLGELGNDYPTLEAILARSFQKVNAPPERKELLDGQDQLRNAITIEAVSLSGDGLLHPLTLGNLKLATLGAQLHTAQIWCLLEKTAESLAVGTKEVFRESSPPTDLTELASDMLDIVIDKATDLGSVTPVFHVFKAIYAWTRRSEQYEEEISNEWDRAEKGMLLSAYFNWWSEGHGSDLIDTLVSKSEDMVKSFQASTETQIQSSVELFERLDNLQKGIKAFQASVEETADRKSPIP